MTNSPNETEVKIRVRDPAAMAQKLSEAGFVIDSPRRFERNCLFDTQGGQLGQSNSILRLRQVGDQAVVTWKGPKQMGRHKIRPEIETAVASFEALRQILERLDFREVFRYEKFRTEYRNATRSGVVTVDETPVGNFIEIEGPAEWIDRTAAALGFSVDDYLLQSYGTLYIEHCQKLGVQPTNMVFPAFD